MESMLPKGVRKGHGSLSPTTRKALHAGLEDLHRNLKDDWSTAAVPLPDDDNGQHAPIAPFLNG